MPERADNTESIKPASTRSLSRLLVYGGATLGVVVAVERALTFLSSMLAARIGGPQTFGAYAIVLATAGTIATYAGAGIGTTANRFSGQYPRESEGYRGFLRALIIISVSSAILGAVLMLAGAGPLARWMLRNEGLTAFLRIAALSSAAFVLLECCRGLFIGQQKFKALFLLSSVSGLGLLIVLPIAATFSPGAMVAGQGCVALLTVSICLVFSRKLGLTPLNKQGSEQSGPGLRPVFSFGVVQFGAVVGINIASWWIASLVARSDSSLAQMGLYAVANQFRGLASIAPGFFTQVGYSLLTNESGNAYGGPNRVMLVNTFITSSLTVLVGGFAMVVAPWILLLAWGRSYSAAEMVVVLLLATAIIHLSGTPAAHRLSIVALRATGIINAVWAVLIIIIGIALVPSMGAKGAAGAFLIAHASTNLMVLACLARSKELPLGYLPIVIVASAGALALAALGYLRIATPSADLIFTAAMLAVWILLMGALLYLGAKSGFVPRQLGRALMMRKPIDEGKTADDLARA